MTTDNHAAYGQLLKQKRIESGLSQKDLAQKLGFMTPQFVAMWERGEKVPNNKKVLIEKIFDLSQAGF